jgi:hypothetical protein
MMRTSGNFPKKTWLERLECGDLFSPWLLDECAIEISGMICIWRSEKGAICTAAGGFNHRKTLVNCLAIRFIEASHGETTDNLFDKKITII